MELIDAIHSDGARGRAPFLRGELSDIVQLSGHGAWVYPINDANTASVVPQIPIAWWLPFFAGAGMNASVSNRELGSQKLGIPKNGFAAAEQP